MAERKKHNLENQRIFSMNVMNRFMTLEEKEAFLKSYQESKHLHQRRIFTPEEIEMFKMKKYTIEQWQKFWKYSARESAMRRLGQMYLHLCGLPYAIGKKYRQKEN